MSRVTTGAAARAAGLGVAATTGALVGFGIRRGAPATMLAAAGDRLRGLPAFVAPDRTFGESATLGLAHHVLLVGAWGLLFAGLAALAARRGAGGSGVARGAVALLVASAAVTADRVLPAWLCLAAGVPALPQRVVLAVALSAALVAGMAIAPRDDA